MMGFVLGLVDINQWIKQLITHPKLYSCLSTVDNGGPTIKQYRSMYRICVCCRPYPSQHDTSFQCRFIVGPASQTMAQY